jgi:hypothetical protein
MIVIPHTLLESDVTTNYAGLNYSANQQIDIPYLGPEYA